MNPTFAISLLWTGFLILIWVISRGMSKVETSLETNLARSASAVLKPVPQEFATPDSVADFIGWYMDTPIYRKITIGMMDYYFDRIQDPTGVTALGLSERCIKPGLVYAPIEDLVDEIAAA